MNILCAESYARMGQTFQPQPLPAAVTHWLAAERAAVDGGHRLALSPAER